MNPFNYQPHSFRAYHDFTYLIREKVIGKTQVFLMKPTGTTSMKHNIALILAFLLLPELSIASEGIIRLQSTYSVSETIDRLEEILKKKGFTIIARVNHGAAAAKVGVNLRETELIIFGNPGVGSPLMACEQSVAIDLPQKALATSDTDGKVWLSYNDPAFLKHRHELEGCDAVLNKISGALGKLAGAAVSSTE
jgi:uncharacterized protein (DUF302 family)